MSLSTPGDEATPARVTTAPAAALRSLVSFEKRCRRPRLIALIVVVMALGGLLGGVALQLRGQPVTATALVRLSQPPDFAAIAGGAGYSTPDPQPITEGYVAGEIQFLSGEKFADAVAESGVSAELTVSQAANSAIVSISSTAGSADEARDAVRTVIEVYEQELAERIQTQLSRVLPVLDQWQTAAGGDPLRSEETARLREAIQVQAQQARTVAVLQPPTVGENPMPAWITGAALGALASGALLWGLVLRRRRSGQATLVSLVADVVDKVVLPPVKLDGRQDTSSSDLTLARTLYAQTGQSDTGRSLIVLGTTPRSGTARIVSLFRAAAADRDSVPVEDYGSIDAPAEPGSEIPTEGRLVVVVRIDVDSADTALPVLAAVASHTEPTLAVFTYESWWRTLVTPRRLTGSG